MSKNGFLVFDSDMHIMEPPDLWQRFTDEEFRDQAPIGVTSENVRDLGTRHPDGTRWGVLAPGSQSTGSRTKTGHNYDKNQLLYADHSSRGDRKSVL